MNHLQPVDPLHGVRDAAAEVHPAPAHRSPEHCNQRYRRRSGPSRKYQHRIQDVYAHIVLLGLRARERGCGTGDLLSAVAPACGGAPDLVRHG